MKVYVCYEANNHSLINDCGNVNNLKVVDNKHKATQYILDSICANKELRFIVDEESQYLLDNRDIDAAKISDDLVSKKYVSIVMFKGHQENWDISFDIIVEVKEVE